MLAALFVSGTLLMSTLGAAPGQYTEKWLCDLYAGAQCHQSSCAKDAKEQCAAASKRCRRRTAQAVAPERAEKTAACAKALLQAACGSEAPAECADVSSP